jgi:amidase
MTDLDLCYVSAAGALAMFRNKRLSPVELMKALIARYEHDGADINCFAHRYFEEAMKQARQAEAVYARRSGEPRALEGIPLAVKDAQRVRGKITTHGSLIFKEHVDDHSDPSIERLQNAGAIVFARTTTPEFCLSGITYSRIWGVTRNPWNRDFTPGGSSGGSGAALAAGMTTLATGTDIGGSIRIPASACGVVGFKPPHGRNPDGPPANFDRFNHNGPMARTVADAALMQSITAGAHPLDHDSLPDPPELPKKSRSIRGMKVAYSIDLGYVEVDPEVRRNTLKAIDVFRALGARIVEVNPAWTSATDLDAVHWYNCMHFGRQTIWHAKENRHLMTDYAQKFAENALRHTHMDDVHKPWSRAHEMYQSLGPILADNDVFICPTNNLPAVPAEHDPWSENFTINGKKADAEFGWVMTHQFNMLHNCPVLAVPSGHASNGVPTGIQIVAKPFADAAVFRAGLAYEKELGGWYASAARRPVIS